MIKFITRHLRRRSIGEVAQSELADAERALLEAQTGRDFAQSTVQYNQARISRLRSFLDGINKGEVPTNG